MWKRALEDTKAFFGWNRKTLIHPFLYVVGLIVYYKLYGAEGVMGEVWHFIAFGLIPVGLFSIFLFYGNLARAPVYTKFEERMKPRLKIERVRKLEYAGQEGGFGLVIYNEGIDRAEDCRGQVIEMEFRESQPNISLCGYLVNQLLRWREGGVGYFSIAGKSRAVLEVVSWKFQKANPLLAYADDSKQIPAFPTDYEILIVVEVTSLNALPIYVICLLDTKWSFGYGYDMKLLGTSAQCPTISDARQLAVDKGGSLTE